MTQPIRAIWHLLPFFVLVAIHPITPLSTAAHGEATTPEKESKASDETTYDLRYKFKLGDVLRYEIRHRASVQSTIGEVTQAAQTSTDSTKLWKITDVLPNGEIEFMNVVERIHMINQLPDRAQVEYDSQRDETPPPGFEDAAKAVGVPLSVVRMTPRGNVVSRKAKLRHTGGEDDGAIVIRLPDQPVAIGATWDEALEVTVQLESGGTKVIQTRRLYKLVDVANGLATIELTYQVLSPINSHIEAQLVQRLMAGTMKFDIDQGRLVKQQMEIDKRILGFAGPTSSMQYVMRMEEKFVDEAPKTAAKPTPPKATSPATKDAATPDAAAKSIATKEASSPAKAPTNATRPSQGVRRTSPGRQRTTTPNRTSNRSRGPADANRPRR